MRTRHDPGATKGRTYANVFGLVERFIKGP
jgi:hypothetical protein